MARKDRVPEKRGNTVVPLTGWRFVKTNSGDEYCVEQLLFQKGELKEVDCYRFDEYGTRFSVHLRPREIADMSEIAEYVSRQQN